jgi:hypothetical protein
MVQVLECLPSKHEPLTVPHTQKLNSKLFGPTTTSMDIYLKECPHKNLYIIVPNSIIYNSPKVETIQNILMGGWLNHCAPRNTTQQ